MDERPKRTGAIIAAGVLLVAAFSYIYTRTVAGDDPERRHYSSLLLMLFGYVTLLLLARRMRKRNR